MPLHGDQITALAKLIARQWDGEKILMFASDHFDLDLEAKVPAGGLLDWAICLLSDRNLPPNDQILLETLEKHGNAAIRAAATELLHPKHFPPTAEAFDAIVVGSRPFVNRDKLREELRRFTRAETRVLVIRGPEPCGKSYSWELLQHVAWTQAAAKAQPLSLKDTAYTPREFVEQVFSLLDLDPARLPRMTDQPQPAHVGPLVNAFMGQLGNLQRRYWLIVDDLNDPGVAPAVRETAYALALAVEKTKPDNLWVALIGYNAEITEFDLFNIAKEDARFYDAEHLAKFLQSISNAGPKPLTEDRALEIATLELTRFPKLTKAAMAEVTISVVGLAENLKLGLQP